MRFIARLLWIALFVLATYSWMVAFEYGFGWGQFQIGFKQEWRNVATMLSGKTVAAVDTPAPAPVNPAAAKK
ncbi:hypothetical protein BH11VER1_BH11VER1_11380 [soil metagenome]